MAINASTAVCFLTVCVLPKLHAAAARVWRLQHGIMGRKFPLSSR